MEPSVDERPTEEGRKGGEAVRATGTGGGSQEVEGQPPLPGQGRAPKSGLQKQRG